MSIKEKCFLLRRVHRLRNAIDQETERKRSYYLEDLLEQTLSQLNRPDTSEYFHMEAV